MVLGGSSHLEVMSKRRKSQRRHIQVCLIRRALNIREESRRGDVHELEIAERVQR